MTRPREPCLLAADLIVRASRARRLVRRPAAATAHARDIYQVIRSQSHRLQFEADEKLSAGGGIESVTPFLDRDLIAYLMSIPGHVQNRGGVPRALLRDAMRGVVPDPILRRRWRAEGLSAPAFARDRQRGYRCAAVTWDGAQALGLLANGSVASTDSTEYMGLEFWSRAFFSDTLARPQNSSEGGRNPMTLPAAPRHDGDQRLPYSAPTLTVHGDLRTITAAKGSNRDEAGQPKTFNVSMP